MGAAACPHRSAARADRVDEAELLGDPRSQGSIGGSQAPKGTVHNGNVPSTGAPGRRREQRPGDPQPPAGYSAGGDPLGGPPVVDPRRKLPRKSLLHLVSAVLNWALAVFSPLVLNTGPVPEVFGSGTFTPFSRMHVANFTSACLVAELLIRPPAPTKAAPPHFFTAASYCARVTPAGSCGPVAPPPRKPPAPPGVRWPGVRFGSVMPFFCRHSRNALKRLAPAPVGPAPVPPVPVEVELVAAAVALVDELFEDPPQAASPRQVSRRARTATAAGFAPAAGLRLFRLM